MLLVCVFVIFNIIAIKEFSQRPDMLLAMSDINYRPELPSLLYMVLLFTIMIDCALSVCIAFVVMIKFIIFLLKK